MFKKSIKSITLATTLLVLFFVSTAYKYRCNNQDCIKFHTGTYYYHFNTNEGVSHYRVVRDDSTQTEINEDNGNISKLKLKWLDDCTYEMHFIEGTEVLPKELLDLKKKMIVKTTVVSGNDKYYIFKSTSNLSNHELQDTVWLSK